MHVLGLVNLPEIKNLRDLSCFGCVLDFIGEPKKCLKFNRKFAFEAKIGATNFK